MSCFSYTLQGRYGTSLLVKPQPTYRRVLVARTQTCKTSAQAGIHRSAEYEVDGNWVVASKCGSVKGICHFLGGAFAGAAPKVAYPLLVDLLSRSGYSVIGTPYAVTFQHDDCARQVHKRFLECVMELRSNVRTQWCVPEEAPVLGVGHSNGALLHLLIGSLCSPNNAGNVIISHNNKQVRDAVPIPLDGLRSAVDQIRGKQSISSRIDAQQVLQQLSVVLQPTGLVREDSLSALGPALQQLGAVFDEVGDGAVDFSPPPAEVRRIIGSSYSVPSTLLVQFQTDSIDETPEMTAILRSRPGLDVASVLLPGTHVTPCGGDVQWPVGRIFTPADALAQAIKVASQAELRRLAVCMTTWMDTRCDDWTRTAASASKDVQIEEGQAAEEAVYASANS